MPASRRLYSALAHEISTNAKTAVEAGYLASIIIPALIEDNPLFNEDKFLSACLDEREQLVAHDPVLVSEVL